VRREREREEEERIDFYSLQKVPHPLRHQHIHMPL
jgi:hypothetical protein